LKLREVFKISEKRTFIETLLIITGIMTGFDSNSIKTLFFVLFALSSISYIIWISIIENRIKNRKFTTKESIINWSLSLFIGLFFSALILFVGLKANLEGTKTINDLLTVVGGWIVVYFMLGFLLILVLGLRDAKTKSLKK